MAYYNPYCLSARTVKKAIRELEEQKRSLAHYQACKDTPPYVVKMIAQDIESREYALHLYNVGGLKPLSGSQPD